MTEICLLNSNPGLISIGLRNGLVPTWHQVISRSNGDNNLCYLEVTYDVYELKFYGFIRKYDLHGMVQNGSVKVTKM